MSKGKGGCCRGPRTHGTRIRVDRKPNLYETPCADQAAGCAKIKQLELAIEAKDELVDLAAKQYFKLMEVKAKGCEKIKKLEADVEELTDQIGRLKIFLKEADLIMFQAWELAEQTLKGTRDVSNNKEVK